MLVQGVQMRQHVRTVPEETLLSCLFPHYMRPGTRGLNAEQEEGIVTGQSHPRCHTLSRKYLLSLNLSAICGFEYISFMNKVLAM